MELNDAVVLVTGAARGLGRVTARAFAEAGAKVAMVDVLEPDVYAAVGELTRSGLIAVPMFADVNDCEQVTAVIEEVRRIFGPVQVLVHAAARLTALGPVWDVDPHRWAADAATNLVGAFHVCRAVTMDMQAGEGGCVINLVGAGTDHVHRYTSAYDCSKAAVIRLTEAIAVEGADVGIKAFSLFPGTVRTEMTRFIAESEDGRTYRPEFADHLEKHAVEPALTARMCLQLAGGKADELSGCWLSVRDDLDALIADAADVRDRELRRLRLRRE